MKTKLTILAIIGILLTSCGAQTATQVIEVITEESVIAPPAQAPMTPDSVVLVTEELIATEPPTAMPTEPALACMTLLTPENGANLPVTGKVTFSWTTMSTAASYVLSIILPSGQTVSFETDQTFRDRYMEAFVSGGEYQWQVVAKGTDGGNICVSEVSAFDKPTYETPKSDGNNGGNNDDGGGDDECTDPDGCGGNH